MLVAVKPTNFSTGMLPQFCGFCGEKTVPDRSGQALFCDACQHAFFPRINPVPMLVVDGPRILLMRNARYRTGFYSCLAGFIEVGVC